MDWKMRAGFIGAVAAVMISGCGRSSSSLTVAGSTAFQPFAEKLADEYMKTHPGSVVNVQGGGSALGVQSAISGAAQIGMADLVKLPDAAKELTPVVAARDGIAVVVHPSNPVKDLTVDQVRELFTGKIVNWKELGGDDRPIHVVSREAGSGTRSSFEDVIGGIQLTPNAIIQDSNGTIRETVANDPGAVGYLSHGLLSERTKALTLAGVPCDNAEMISGRYPLVRPMYLLTRGPAQGEAKAFLDYVLSPEGQAIIARSGLLPIK